MSSEGAKSNVSLWRRLGYSFGEVGIGLAQVPINLLFLFYLTEIVGLRAGLAGLVLALPKVWDALVDPMLGGWTDRLAIRLGHRAPVALVAGGVYVAALFFMFTLPPLHSPWQIVTLATLLLMALSTAQTAFAVSQLAVATEMTNDSTSLSALLSLVAVVSTLFSISGNFAVPFLIPWSGGGRIGYSAMAGEIALASALAMSIYIFTTRNVPVSNRSAGSETMSLFASIRATAANRAFYYVMAYLICFGIAAGVLGAFLTFANRYVLHGDARSLAALGSIFGVFGIIGLPLAPIAVKRLGEARGMRIANLGVAIAFSSLFAASFGPIWLSWIAVGGVGIFAGALSVLMRTTLIDVARVELKNAVVVPLGVYLGIMIAGLKLGASGGTFAAGELLDLIGFVSGGVQQSSATIEWLRAGYTLFPVAWLFAGGLFLRHISTSPQTGKASVDAATS